ncbi:replication termination factor, putative [Plasmodium relictum]|uniref:Replication termination factor, putative n=1 Tax=Plasmodium relictum TaxID=85471 RepID=A0A1J1H466_PLARL|nr:replication termination factor, putative [Plasmodium relictum]CRG99480.1 replication termination factor, putative [Plasmodium relictum]
MGGDGGSLPQRVDLVKMKNKKLKENIGSLGYEKNTLVTITQNKYNKKELKEYYFNHCAISQEPIFCCRLGYLYNKENILKLILFRKQNKKKRKRDIYEKFSHIDSLKDLVVCKNKLNEESKLICLISNEIINSTSGGICIFSCGCVFSKKVFNHINNTDENLCIICNKKYKLSDIIEIGIDDESILEEKKKIIRKKKLNKNKELSRKNKEISNNKEEKKKIKQIKE